MTDPKTIDSHCHIQHGRFDEDRDKIISMAKEKMHFMIESGANPEWNRGAIEISEKHRGFVYPTLGLHPMDAQKMDDKRFDEEIEYIRNNKDKIVGVGEVGMDHHWEKDPELQELQKVRFKRFIKLANEIDKPLVIHSWDAEQDAVDILAEYAKVPVVMHSFSGKPPVLQDALDNGFYISFTTMILSSRNHKKLAKKTPLDRIFLETDSPYLGPERKRNVPWNTLLSAEKIATVKDVDRNEVLENAIKNARRIFRI